MSKKIFFNQNRGQWLFKLITSIIGIISIIADVLGLACLSSNPNILKTVFYWIVLFYPACVILSIAIVFVLYGGFQLWIDPEKGAKVGGKIIINSSLASYIPGIFIVLSNLTLLKVPFGIHLLFSYSFLLLLLFGLQVYYSGWLAIPEKDRYARFIALLKELLPRQFQEEWLGDLQEQHYQLIEQGSPRWQVSLITLLTGLDLIRSYLGLKFHKFVSRWMTRA
ncbi:MAG: hypothetical protein ACM65M_15130 [Microcoleus sp.]